MIPFQKIFTLVVRTFSKPVLSFLKQRQQQNKMVFLRWIFVRFGRRYQLFQHWLNHKILKTTHKKQMNELKDQILLEKGIEAVYEIFFYSIVIGLPMYELYTSALSAHKKEKKLLQNLAQMQKDLKQVNMNLSRTVEEVKLRTHEHQKLIAQRQKKLAQIRRQKEERRKKQYKEYLLQKEYEEHERLKSLMKQQLAQRKSYAIMNELSESNVVTAQAGNFIGGENDV